MFQGCTSLTKAPTILPATTLAQGCYCSMFQRCTSLTTAPELPATTFVESCYRTMFSQAASGTNKGKISYIKMLGYDTNNKKLWYNLSDWINLKEYSSQYLSVAPNGTFVQSKDASLVFGTSGIPWNWKVINNETNNEVYPLKFNTSTFNVSTYVGENYSGTIQNVSCNRTIPNGLVKYYLDSSLLSSNTYTLTTTGNHTITALIVADTSLDDSSVSYTINYTREKKDATLRVNFSPASGTQTCSVGDQLATPTITTNNRPASVSTTITYSTDGENYSNSLPQYVDTSTAGTHAIYVKQEISNYDFTYKPQTQIFTWEYTVEAEEFGGLTVKYNITDGEVGQEIALFNFGGSSSGSSESGSSDSTAAGGTLPSSMIVDGVEETPINSWRFLTTGEHIVQFTFADNTIPQNFINDNVPCATEVIVGKDITEISNEAFNKNLTSATCLSTTPLTLVTNTVFGLEQEYPIYVPAESVESYKGGPRYWSEYASRIYPISE